MSALLECLDVILAETVDPQERSRLEDARKAAQIIASIPDPEERRVVISVLEKLDTIIALADAIASSRIVPFPHDRLRQRGDPGGKPEPFLVD